MDSASSTNDVDFESSKLIERSSSWTLRCDNLLLNKLENISKNFEQTSSEILKDCTALSNDVTVLHAQLGNVTNQFLMLSNNQFVENRVEEFEEISNASSTSQLLKSIEKPDKTKSEKEAELIAKMKESIQLGITAIEQNSITLSSDDNCQTQNLALPYLIGSPKYFSSRYVGLIDDEFGIEQPNRSTNTLPSSLSPQPPQVQPNTDLEEIPSSIDNISNISNKKPTVIPTSHIETVPNGTDFIQPSKQDPIQQTVISPHTYKRPEDTYFRRNFEAPPPPNIDTDESDDDFTPIMGKGPGGRLFVDDDDDDLFSDKSLLPPKPMSNSFFNGPPVIPPTPIIHANQVSQPNSCIPNVTTTKTTNSSNERVQIERHNSTEEKHSVHESEALVTNTRSLEPKKIPPGAVPIFGVVPHSEILRPTQKTSQPKLITDEPEVKTVQDVATTHSCKTSRPGTNSNRDIESLPTSHVSTRGKSSYNQDSPKNPDTNPSDNGFVNNSSVYKKSTLLNDDTLNSDTFGAGHSKQSLNAKLKAKASIFDESDSEDDLFSSAPTKIKQNQATSISNSFTFKNKNIAGLFNEDSDDGDLFSEISHDKKPSTTNDHSYRNDLNNVNYSKQPEFTYTDKKFTALKDDVDMSSDSFDTDTIKRTTDQQPEPDCKNPPDLQSLLANEVNEKSTDNNTLKVSMDSSPPVAENQNGKNSPTEKIVTDNKISQIKQKLASDKAKELEQADKKKSLQGQKLKSDSKVNVKKLAVDLKINPLAMRPGSKPAKQSSGDLFASNSVESNSNDDLPVSLSPKDFDPDKLILDGTEDGSPQKSDEPVIAVTSSVFPIVSSDEKTLETSNSNESQLKDKELESSKSNKVEQLGKKLLINPLALKPQSGSDRKKSLDTPETPTSSVLKNVFDDHVNNTKIENNITDGPISPFSAIDSSLSDVVNENETSAIPSSDEPLKRPNVKKLALGLNINPLALRPGAKLDKSKSLESPQTPTPSSEESKTFPDDTVQDISKEIIPNKESPKVEGLTDPVFATIEISSRETSPIDGDPENSPHRLLSSLAKNRVKVFAKRRPPSKKLLHTFSDEQNHPSDSMDCDVATNEYNEIDNFPESETLCIQGESESEHKDISLPVSSSSQNLLREETNETIQNEAEKTYTEEIKTHPSFISNEPPPLPSIWDDDSDSDDIFSSLPNKFVDPVIPEINNSLTNNPSGFLDDKFLKKDDDNKHTDTNQQTKSISISEEVKVPVLPELDAVVSNSNGPIKTDIHINGGSEDCSKENDELSIKRYDNVQKKTLFSDGPESDDDIFSSKSISKTIGKDDVKPKEITPTVSTQSQPPKLQHHTKTSSAKKSGPKTGLFDSGSDSDDLFQGSKGATASKKSQKDSKMNLNQKQGSAKGTKDNASNPKNAKNANKSLFSDSSDDGNDLFAPKGK